MPPEEPHETTEELQSAIEAVLSRYQEMMAQTRPGCRVVTCFDRQHNHFLLVEEGWERRTRVHTPLVHAEIANNKVYLHRDATRKGVVWDLCQAGVPRERMVVAFLSQEERLKTEFAPE
jgi:hypothetical protein